MEPPPTLILLAGWVSHMNNTDVYPASRPGDSSPQRRSWGGRREPAPPHLHLQHCIPPPSSSTDFPKCILRFTHVWLLFIFSSGPHIGCSDPFLIEVRVLNWKRGQAHTKQFPTHAVSLSGESHIGKFQNEPKKKPSLGKGLKWWSKRFKEVTFLKMGSNDILLAGVLFSNRKILTRSCCVEWFQVLEVKAYSVGCYPEQNKDISVFAEMWKEIECLIQRLSPFGKKGYGVPGQNMP